MEPLAVLLVLMKKVLQVALVADKADSEHRVAALVEEETADMEAVMEELEGERSQSEQRELEKKQKLFMTSLHAKYQTRVDPISE